MFCYTHLKKHLKDNDQNITEANIQIFKYSAMERPIKVNRHKGGGVDIYFWREAWVQIPSESEFFSVFSFCNW